MLITGLSEVIGSWKIIATSPPRTRRMARSDRRRRSCPPRRIAPATTRSDVLGSSRMIASEVTDLPEPDLAGEAERLAGLEVEAHFMQHAARTERRARVEAKSLDREHRHGHEKTILGK